MVLSASLQAQAYLYLQKEGEVPDHRWKQGEYVEVLLNNGEEDYWHKAYFNGGDSAGIILNTRYFATERILAIRYPRGLVPILSKSLMAAAGLFSGVFATNAIINDERPILTDKQIGLGIGLFGAGAALHFFRYKERALSEGYELRIIDISKLESWKRLLLLAQVV